MASQFAVFALHLHHEGLLNDHAMRVIDEAEREAIAWLHHWSMGGPADAIPIIARHRYRPLFQAAAMACRDLRTNKETTHA